MCWKNLVVREKVATFAAANRVRAFSARCRSIINIMSNCINSKSNFFKLCQN